MRMPLRPGRTEFFGGEEVAIDNFWKNIAVIVLFLLLTASGIFLSSSVHIVRGNARTVNSAGLVQGEAQRLVKWELAGRKNNALMSRIDRILGELEVGGGEDGLPGFADPAYRKNLENLQKQWEELKAAIGEARRTGEREPLFDLSEGFFESSGMLTDLAERLSERNADFVLTMRMVLLAVSAALLVCFLLQACESIQLLFQNRFFEEKATKDPMTSLPNRWSCDLRIEKYRGAPHLSGLACFMVDLNNLKKVNDSLGHAVGDRLIVAFARILEDCAAPYGFVGRNGGDEFLGFFEGCDAECLRGFRDALRESVARYNRTSEAFEIQFAFGAALSCELEKASIFALINMAEQRMYKDKAGAREETEKARL